MRMLMSRLVGYVFLILALVQVMIIILLSLRESSPAGELDFWITVILALVYVCGLIIALWKQFISGILLVVTGLAIGLPNAVLNIWAGAIFGLPPLIAGIAFITAWMYSQIKQTASA